MKEHRCPKCNKLLFKYSDDAVIKFGKIEIETQHHCRAEGKSKDIKTIP